MMQECKVRTRVDGYFKDEYDVIVKNGTAEMYITTITMLDPWTPSDGWYVYIAGNEVHSETKRDAVCLAIETHISRIAEFVDDDDLLFRYGKHSWRCAILKKI
jgi:hypothetical protein